MDAGGASIGMAASTRISVVLCILGCELHHCALPMMVHYRRWHRTRREPCGRCWLRPFPARRRVQRWATVPLLPQCHCCCGCDRLTTARGLCVASHTYTVRAHRCLQVYDGDTPQSERADIRNRVQLLITNPGEGCVEWL
jgi:hypothetical protein